MASGYLLVEARQARLSNDYKSAQNLTRAYLEQTPDDPEGQSFLGLCLIETGQTHIGKPMIELAFNRAPENFQILSNLSILREIEGNLKEAVVAATRAAELAPNRFEAWGHLGALLGRCAKFKEASDALKQAHQIDPNHAGIILLLAGASLEINDLESAKIAIARYEAIAPPTADLWKVKCNFARSTSDWTMLRKEADKWLKSDPHNDDARTALAFALAQSGYFDTAIKVYTPLVSMRKPPAEHLAAIGRYYLGARDLENAEIFFIRAIDTEKDCAEAHFGMSRLKTYLGHLDTAETYCRTALQINPNHAEAYGQLSEITNGNISDADLEKITALLKNETLTAETRAILLFAKGDAYHRRKAPIEAFKNWQDAGTVKRGQLITLNISYSEQVQEDKIQSLKHSFSNSCPTQKSTSPSRPTPIFIIGMPRSGTTLIENAIAAHHNVDGAGEIPAMPFLVDKFLSLTNNNNETKNILTDDLIEEWRALYLQQAIEFGAGENEFFTDKQPANYLSVGLIRQIFPSSPIIHIRRGALETGFSIFRRNFTRQWPFANDLSDIAHCYSTYAVLMDHWHETYSDNLKFIQYEKLVVDFEKLLRDAISFCGLPWDERCLRYFEQDRSVITFSATQVRKPPSKEHLNTTAPYKTLLFPLRDRLLNLGINPDDGALRN